MTEDEFNILWKDLKTIATTIPQHWGKVQNDVTDAQLDLFGINTYQQLLTQLQPLNISIQNYYLRRWFIWQCSRCDEYLFGLNTNVMLHKNRRSKDYDIQFANNSKLQFDIKGTVIPKQFRTSVDAVIENPTELINFLYKEQSKGVREGYQNRLFIVHHSLLQQQRELMLRCCFNFKKHVFAAYSNQIMQRSFYNYENAIADVIFIVEDIERKLSSNIIVQP